jgi:hypothetical protein
MLVIDHGVRQVPENASFESDEQAKAHWERG